MPAAPARDAARRPSTTSSGPPTCCRAVARLPERWPPCRSVARVPEVPVAGDEGSRRPPAQLAPASGGRPPRSGCRRWPARPRPRPAGCCPAPRRPGELLIPRRRVPRARGPRRGRTVRRATRRRARFLGPARGLARGGRAQGPTRGGGRRVCHGIDNGAVVIEPHAPRLGCRRWTSSSRRSERTTSGRAGARLGGACGTGISSLLQVRRPPGNRPLGDVVDLLGRVDRAARRPRGLLDDRLVQGGANPERGRAAAAQEPARGDEVFFQTVADRNDLDACGRVLEPEDVRASFDPRVQPVYGRLEQRRPLAAREGTRSRPTGDLASLIEEGSRLPCRPRPTGVPPWEGGRRRPSRVR